jgi:hypothetical protein
VSPIDPQHGDASGGFGGAPPEAIEVVNSSGDAMRYAAGDFDELFATSDARELRRYVGLGWLLLDERVGRTAGHSASWLDTALRRSAGRVLAAQDDPQYEPPADLTTYVLGHLGPGATGTPVT